MKVGDGVIVGRGDTVGAIDSVGLAVKVGAGVEGAAEYEGLLLGLEEGVPVGIGVGVPVGVDDGLSVGIDVGERVVVLKAVSLLAKLDKNSLSTLPQNSCSKPIFSLPCGTVRPRLWLWTASGRQSR